jgi:hypothetical protein
MNDIQWINSTEGLIKGKPRAIISDRTFRCSKDDIVADKTHENMKKISNDKKGLLSSKRIVVMKKGRLLTDDTKDHHAHNLASVLIDAASEKSAKQTSTN